MINITFKLEVCYDKAQQILPKTRWYASLQFLIGLLILSGIFLYFLIPKESEFEIISASYIIG